MRELTRFEKLQLKQLYRLGVTNDFETLLEPEFTAKVTRFIDSLTASEAFMYLQNQNPVLRRIYKNINRHFQEGNRTKILNDRRLILTNLYRYKDET